jgi:hypothetical protein
MPAGRPHEAAGNGIPRWMVPVAQAGAQKWACGPARPSAELRKRGVRYPQSARTRLKDERGRESPPERRAAYFTFIEPQSQPGDVTGKPVSIAGTPAAAGGEMADPEPVPVADLCPARTVRSSLEIAWP